MSNQQESPRYVLILGGLFLVAYAAYRVGLAWMGVSPFGSSMWSLFEPYPPPEPTSIPFDPIPGVEVVETPYPAYPGVEISETPLEPYPGIEFTPTPMGPYPEVEITDTPMQPYPGVEATNTPAQAYPGVEVTNTPNSPYPGPESNNTPTPAPTEPGFTPTQTQPISTPTPDGEAYPGPATPVNTSTLDPNAPYLGPEQTPTSNPGNPYPGPEQSPTPTLSPTPITSTPTAIPTQFFVTTLENTPAPITTLTYSETLIIPGGIVYQAVWLDDATDLAMATSGGIVLHPPAADKYVILDEGTPFFSAAYIPGDNWIAAGGKDSLIRIWDLTTNSFIKRLTGHLLGVVNLSYSNVRSFLASASDDATVRIWDKNGNPLHVLRGPITRVLDMAVSLNGQMVAAASNQHVHIWNPQSGELTYTISQPTGWYTAVAINPSSQTLAAGINVDRLEFWDTATWERVDFIPMEESVQSLTYHPSGRMLAIGYDDGRIQIRDLMYNYLKADLTGHPGITSMAFNTNGEKLVTSSDDGSIRIWDLAPLFNP